MKNTIMSLIYGGAGAAIIGGVLLGVKEMIHPIDPSALGQVCIIGGALVCFAGCFILGMCVDQNKWRDE